MSHITIGEFDFAFKQADNVELLGRAIEQGFNINEFHMGGTLLSIACYYGRIKCVRLLLEHNASPNIIGLFGDAPLKKAVTNPEFSNVECVRLLIDVGANINYKSTNGTDALMQSARIGKLDCVQYLLDAGADSLAVDWTGKTASMIARDNGYLEIADLIDNYGEPIKSALEVDDY